VRRVAAAALLLLCAALAGCNDTKVTKVTHRADDTNKGVLVIGDSNVFNSTRAIDTSLRDADFKPIVHGLPGFGAKDFGIYWATALEQLLQTDPAVVVVALGGNDSFLIKQVAAFDVHLDQMMEAIGDREVIWITHVDQRRGPNPSGSAVVNQKIRDAAARWDNLVILDFTKVITADPTVLAADGLHFSPTGTTVYSEAIRDAVRDVYKKCGGDVVAGCA
jgi:GDSL-like lipase/acylhydrolase family protein